jgi:hypothetical protein
MVNFMCVLSALLFMTGNILVLVYYIKEYNRAHFDYELYRDLDPAYIQQEWDWRIDNRPKLLAAGLINSLAWLFLTFPLLELSWILSLRGSKWIALHIGIGVLALTGSFTEWISRFLYIGTTMATELMVNEFNLNNWLTSSSDDQIGWRALEVTHVVTYGLVAFADAFEWIILFVIFVLVHISVKNWRRNVDGTTFGACWNALGLFVALMCLLEFVAEVLRLDSYRTFGQIAFWYSAVNRLVLMPSWLIMLGMRLPYASVKLNHHAPTGRQSAMQQQSSAADVVASGVH